jgi:hypothetical protein
MILLKDILYVNIYLISLMKIRPSFLLGHGCYSENILTYVAFSTRNVRCASAITVEHCNSKAYIENLLFPSLIRGTSIKISQKIYQLPELHDIFLKRSAESYRYNEHGNSKFLLHFVKGNDRNNIN